MILYNNSILIPQHRNGLIRKWIYDGTAYYEGCGEIVNNHFKNTYEASSGATNNTASIGLTLPVSVHASGTWLKGEFLIGGNWKTSITAKEILSNGRLSTARTIDGIKAPYYEITFRISLNANNSETSRRGTLTFRPNGWETDESPSGSDLENLGGPDACIINVTQKGKPAEPDPPQQEYGSIRITIQVLSTQVYAVKVTISVAGENLTYDSTGAQTITNPYTMTGVPTGTYNAYITECSVKPSQTSSWVTGNASCNPSSVNVTANGTANLTVSVT